VSLTACVRHNELKATASNSELQQKLAGIWKTTRIPAVYQSTVTVASNGIYVCDVTDFSRVPSKSDHLEGQWEIKDGFLIDTVTNSSATNIQLPMVLRAKIIQFNGDKLVLHVEHARSNLEEVVFEKENRN
jgi:hypothetical protein